MSVWAIQFSQSDVLQCGALWRVPKVSVLSREDSLWLQIASPDDSTLRLLSCLPCLGRFEVLDHGALLREGNRVPQGYLPQGSWRSLQEYLQVSLPGTVLPTQDLSKIPVTLVPSTAGSDANLLWTDVKTWVEYGIQAPLIRLRNLKFAASRDGRVLIAGSPLPPIPGTRGVADSGVAVPCGWSWAPAVEAEVLVRAWQIPREELWLLWPGRPVERVLADHWVSANHSAIRETAEACQHAGI